MTSGHWYRRLLRNPGRLLLASTALYAGPAAALSAQDSARAEEPACPTQRILELGPLDSPTADFARVLEITGLGDRRARVVRRQSAYRTTHVCGPVPWSGTLEPLRGPDGQGPLVTLLAPRTEGSVLTGYAADRNNGALWAGRGLSLGASAGVALDWGVFSAALAPEVYYQRNAAFPVSIIALQRKNRERSIDWPTRIGTRPFANIEPGQSYARVDAYNVAVGVATENIWVGPGLRQSILMSNTAPGFPHFFIGTSRPAPVWIGDLEVQAFWGGLDESPFYDDDPSNDGRMIAAFVASFQPLWLPGLHIGGVRMLTQVVPDDGLDLGDYFALFRYDLTNETLGEDLSEEEMDQVIEVFARWVFPESGLEVFGEWARNDRSADLYDFIAEPDHGRGYLLGLQKVIEAGPGWVRLHGEILNVENSLSRLHRRHGAGYYEHNFVRQGHTHRGQLLGAWSGPGSSSQTIAADLFADWGSVGILAERVRRDTDYYFSTENLRRGYPLKMDVELTAGLRGTAFTRGVELDWGLSYSRRTNRDFLPPEPDEVEQGYRVDPNWRLHLGLTWRPRLEQRTLLGQRVASPALARSPD